MSATSFVAIPNPGRKGHRLWLPIVIGLLAVIGVALIQFQPELERNFKSWMVSLVVILGIALELLWFLCFSRLNGLLRLAAFFLLIFALFGLAKTVRVDGTVNGTGLPKLVWRWNAGGVPRHPTAVSFAAATDGVAAKKSAESYVDVPQFFGPNRDGTVTNAHLAHDWKTSPPKQLWRQPAGAAWSAFAVVGGHIFTQEQRGEGECVTCYELLTGKPVWAHTNAARFFQWQGGEGPRATPTVYQGQVFAIGATGILDCLDAATGEKKWSRDVLAENKIPNITWGISDSPLVFDDTVVVTGGMTNGPTILAYRRGTGEPLWHSGDDRASYASPLLATLAGKPVVLSCNANSLTFNDAKTGELLLNYPWVFGKWPKASQPVVLPGDRIFISAGYGAGCMLLEIKADNGGKLTANQLWKNQRMKTQFNSVAARDGFLYGLDDGLLACVEIATGDRKWKDGRFGSGQTLLVDDAVIVQSETGAVILAAAKPEAYVELGRLNALDGKTWNHPTLAGRYLLVRNAEEMACYELPLQPNGLAALVK